MDKTDSIAEAAGLLRKAYNDGNPCRPVREAIGLSLEAGYAVQQINTQHWVREGRRICGRKIGLTSAAVQRQLGVEQPDFGALFADMEYGDGEEISFARLQQPRTEAEVALIFGRALEAERVTVSELMRAVEYVVPAIEVVGSRIAGWDIKISDTIADNASSGVYVLGGPARRIVGLELSGCGMIMRRNGRPVSYGAGAACLGNPLNAAVWLARELVKRETPLREGDVVLTGALGPMVEATPDDVFEAEIEGLGAVRAAFGPAQFRSQIAAGIEEDRA